MTPQYRIEQYLAAMTRSNNDTPVVFADGFPGWNGETPNTPRPGWSIEEYLEQLVHTAAVLALPPVTEENNGDFMTVVDGEWAPADITLDEKIAADVGEWLEDHPEATTTVQDGAITFPKLAADLKSLLVHDTVSGTVANFDYAAGGLPFDSVVADIEPIQDLHGYATPWPAGGGKNKLNPLATYKGCTYNTAVGTTLNPVAADKSWQDAGNDTFTISNLGSWSQACLISDPLPLGKAYVKISNVRGAVKCSVYVCNGDFKVNRVSFNRNPVPEGDTIVVNTTFANDDTYFVVYLAGSGADASIQYPYAYSGDTAATDSFSPYSNICPISGLTGLSVYVSPTQDPDDATVYAVDWTTQAGVVYGGTLDVVTGVLTVDREKVTYDGSENWTAYPSFEGYLRYEPSMKHGLRQNGVSNMLKDSKSTQPGQKNCMWLGVNTQYIYVIGVYETMGSTVADFRSYLAENNLEIVFPLATPITYQLTPKQIAALTENYVWASNGGNVSVTFIADTKSYINMKIAEAMAAALNA